jgi:catechol 2,3-dioxygenase-like lactoylglutathione lyase family enzyme
MNISEVRNDAISDASVARVDMKLEVVVIPVSDVDRAKEFYGQLGWRLDADFPFDNGFRVVQFTPPGSGCSVQFGTNMTSAAPGSSHALYLIVSDIEAARDQLVARGVEVSELFHTGTPGAQFQGDGTSGRIGGPAPDDASYRSFATFSDPDGNGWLLQEITTRLPGAHRHHVFVQLRKRPGERVPAGGGRPRPAREAHRAARRKLGRLVRGVHRGRAGRPRAAAMKDDGMIVVAHYRSEFCYEEDSGNRDCRSQPAPDQRDAISVHAL